LTTGIVLPRPALLKVTEFGYWLSPVYRWFQRKNYQLVIHDSIAGDMRCGYGDGFRRAS
jgi:hypothetical protein